MSAPNVITDTDLFAQHQYVEKLRKNNFDFSSDGCDSFIRGHPPDDGTRHSTYNEFLDNCPPG